MLVLDCTGDRGVIGACWLYGEDQEDPADYQAGFPPLVGDVWPDAMVLAPASRRTTAQHYDYQGRNSHIYWGRGGLSWAIPYASGVLAMGWQVQPELHKEQMMALLHSSAYCDAMDNTYIMPAGFIERLQTMVQQGGNYFAAPGGRFWLRAAAFGSAYQWWKNGEPVVDEPGRVTGATTRTLTISSLTEADEGTYTCMYDDGTGLIETEAHVLELVENLPAASDWGLLVVSGLLLLVWVRLCLRPESKKFNFR